MAHQLRQKIANYLRHAESKVSSPLTTSWCDHSEKIPWCVRFVPVGKRYKESQSHLCVPYKSLRAAGLLSSASKVELSKWASDICDQFQADDVIKRCQLQSNGIGFVLNQENIIKNCLQEISNQGDKFGFRSDFQEFAATSDGENIEKQKNDQKIVVEYSSPNIAKPFHAGHLRSTIIGNVLSNVFQRLGHDVTRINFLGNWGTQFGLLGVGYQKYGDEDALQTNPLEHLFQIYVRINEEASKDESIKQEARNFFSKMEKGDPSAISLWQTCMDKSIQEYTTMYKRLGVHFDRYDGEAMYVKDTLQLVNSLKESGILETDSVTGVGYVDLSAPDEAKKTKYANLIRSDGATLYLTRDLAAAIDRFNKYKFDRHLYVVENSQHAHFEQLILALRRLGHSWAQRPLSDFHVKFGRVEGMSSRRGEVVLLRDILDEAKRRMADTMAAKQTTKVSDPVTLEAVSDTLASSAIIVQDLRQRRALNYRFSWDRMLDFRGDTGVSLQYTHARLNNIEVNCGVTLTYDCDLGVLTEPCALNLVLHLARYDEALQSAAVELEPCVLVQYLFHLSRLIHVATDELYVKNQPLEIAQARLLLFHCSREVLASGLRTLGIQPLDAL